MLGKLSLIFGRLLCSAGLHSLVLNKIIETSSCLSSRSVVQWGISLLLGHFGEGILLSFGWITRQARGSGNLHFSSAP